MWPQPKYASSTLVAGPMQARKDRTHPINLGSLWCAAAALVAASILLAACGTPNDLIVTSALSPPAPHQYKTADSPDRYTASCHDDNAPSAARESVIVPAALASAETRHTPGDIVQIAVQDDTQFSGNYEINLDGRIVLPYAGAIRSADITTSELQARIKQKLVSSGMFLDREVRVAVLPVHWAPIQVSIEGAVFQAGTDFVNEPSEKALPPPVVKTGEAPVHRYLREAFRVGAGVRPDADLTNVTLKRSGHAYRLDLSGAINGGPVPLVPLMSGDVVSVPSSGCFHKALFRPSQLTPPGIRVFMSNLTQTATSNTEAAIGQFASNVPYGTRLLEGIVSANCVGGAPATNAGRRVVLISRNTLDRKTEVIERSVSELLAQPDDPNVNPYLMPNDAIACYDSEFSNARDVAKGITEILGAVTLLHAL